MYKCLCTLLFSLLFTSSQSQVKNVAKMFRDNAAHNSYINSQHDLVYDTPEWQFNAGSPVRSTVLINNNIAYFGDAAGKFYAINKKNAAVKWIFSTGQSIHSSAACMGGKVYFSDNGQTVYCLKEINGQVVWKFTMGAKKDYPWRYDYTYSSPVLYNNMLLIGSDNGSFYALNLNTGKQIWKFDAKGIIRSTAAVYRGLVIFGDTEANLYALDINTGKQKWKYEINGHDINNEDWGFDRRAINSTPVVVGDRVIFGARDGFLYCVNGEDGKNIWTVDHQVSWVTSTVAVRDSFVITGTSDGRFVQAVNLETGKQIWKFRTANAVWSSPLIINNTVYAGSFDGQLYCLDLKNGNRLSEFKANGKILSSPVWDDGLLYIGCDDGHLYALSGHKSRNQNVGDLQRFVYYENGVNVYFKGNSDVVIKNYLRNNGFKLIGSDSLTYYMSKESSSPSVFVFASCLFPQAIIADGSNSIIRKYLEQGGKIVMTGTNPLVYMIDEKSKQAYAFRPGAADTILNIDYGKGDTRTFMGDFPSFPTEKGKQIGLPAFWTNSVFINEKNADVILGKNENGYVSAFAKNYSNGGQFVQLWMDADRPDRLDAIIKAAEWKLE